MSSDASPASSTAHLVQKPHQKDYSSALASLQTSYGFGGSPMVPKSSKAVRPRTSQSTTASTSTSTPSSPSTPRPKREFTGFLTSFGFGGHTPPPNSTTVTPKSSPLSSSPSKQNSPNLQSSLHNSSPAAASAPRN